MYKPPIFRPGRDLIEQLNSEFSRLVRTLNGVGVGVYPVARSAPTKNPKVGTVKYADGTSWNPGSGEGLYVYKSTGWTFLG